MAVDPLTVTVATVLAALAAKALEGVGGEAGRSAWSAMSRLVGVVRRRFARDSQAMDALKQAQEHPDDEGAIQRLAEELRRHIAQDPGFGRQLADWVGNAERDPALRQIVTQVSGQAQIGTIITAGVIHDGVHVSVTPPSSPVPAQLPSDIADFTGREAELSRLRALLSDDERGQGATVVISAIAGMAGVGKTALAMHLAHELAVRFPDGQLYVNLYGYEPVQRLDPAQTLDRFLRALGTAAEALPTTVDEQAALYRSLLAGKRVLVILDNASSSEQVRPLLPGSPDCAVLVTSRDTLAGLVAQDGARSLNLDVLPPAEAVELLARTAGDNRHEQVRHDLRTAAEVVRLCGYLPLAVRIVGAQLATHPGQTIALLAAELGEEQRRLRRLEAEDVGVRASFALSYQCLSLATARMFRCLGLIAGPDFTPHAAAALTETALDDARRQLDELVDAHLLEQSSELGRYRFHDLLRLYARERAEAEESGHDRDAAILRTLGWYLVNADAADRLLAPGPHQHQRYRASASSGSDLTSRSQAVAWFEAERTSLVAATRQAAERGFASIAWQLPDSLWRFFHFRKYWANWCDTHQVGLSAAQRSGDSSAEGGLLANLSVALRELYRFDEALDCCHQALVIFRQIGDCHGESRTLTNLGAIHAEQRRFDEAIDCCRQALTMQRELGDRYREGVTLFTLGAVYRDHQRFDEAIGHYQQALTVFHQIDDRHGEGNTLANLVLVHIETQRFDEAMSLSERALALFREIGDRHGEGRTLDGLGLVYRSLRRFEEAMAYFEQELTIDLELGNRAAQAVTLTNLGSVYSDLERWEEALRCYHKALPIYREFSDARREALLLANLGHTCRKSGRYDEASMWYQREAAIRQRLDDHPGGHGGQALEVAFPDAREADAIAGTWRERLIGIWRSGRRGRGHGPGGHGDDGRDR